MIGVYVVAISNFSALHDGVLIIIIISSFQSSGHTTTVCLHLQQQRWTTSSFFKNSGQPGQPYQSDYQTDFYLENYYSVGKVYVKYSYLMLSLRGVLYLTRI